MIMLQTLTKGGIIAVIRRIQAEKVEEIADALVSSGITALEITVDSADSYEIINKLSRRFEGKAVVGAGTVLDGYAAYQAIHSGAEFIFSPTLNIETIRTTLRYGKISIPGVMTPTEALTAIEHGADAVKIFPASTIGNQFLKDLKAPCPQIPMIPTGGINLENIESFIQNGAISVGIGGNLIKGDYDFIKENAAKYVNKVKEARKFK